jgi:hypothetical protein
MRSAIALLLVLFAWPGTQLLGADGELSCRPDETLEGCLNRVHSEVSQAEAAGRDLRAEAQETNTAAVSRAITAETADKTASSTGLGGASSQRDSLAAFLAGLGLGEVTEGAEEGALLFHFNPDLFRIGDAHKLSLQALARQPEIYQPLADSVPAALAEDLDDFDDLQVDLFWSLETTRFGRRFLPHRSLLGDFYSELLDVTSRSVPELPAAATALSDFLEDYEGLRGVNLQTATFSDLPPAAAAELESRVIAIALGAARWVQAEDALGASTGFDRLPDLLNNQPQLSISGFYRSRDELAGPDIWGVEGSWEFGWANLNGLRRYARVQRSEEAKPILADLRSFVGTEVSAGTLKTAPRFAVKLKYQETDPYDISLEDGTVTLDLDRATSWFGSLATGGYLRIAEDGTQTGRWDLETEYEDVSDDPNREDRLVATLTMTQKLADGTDGHVSLVWASKPQYLGEVDEELSARVGLKYGIDRKEK